MMELDALLRSHAPELVGYLSITQTPTYARLTFPAKHLSQIKKAADRLYRTSKTAPIWIVLYSIEGDRAVCHVQLMPKTRQIAP